MFEIVFFNNTRNADIMGYLQKKFFLKTSFKPFSNRFLQCTYSSKIKEPIYNKLLKNLNFSRHEVIKNLQKCIKKQNIQNKQKKKHAWEWKVLRMHWKGCQCHPTAFLIERSGATDTNAMLALVVTEYCIFTFASTSWVWLGSLKSACVSSLLINYTFKL